MPRPKDSLTGFPSKAILEMIHESLWGQDHGQRPQLLGLSQTLFFSTMDSTP